METLPKDILFEIALELSGKDLIQLCKTSKKYKYICDSNIFWRKKIYKDYNLNVSNNPKYIYRKIKENNEICNQKLLEGKGKQYVINEIQFDNEDDQLVYNFIVSKILESGGNYPNYFRGIYDRHIEKINYKYENKILRDTDFPSEDEYKIFLELLEKANVTEFQKSYINGILKRGISPNVTWNELCEYPLY